MLVIGINGSPAKNGNTAYLLDTARETVEGLGACFELVHAADALRGLRQPFCTACSTPCTGVCYQNKRLAPVLARLRQADAVLLGSPVYFGTVSAQMKAFWDHTRLLRAQKALLNVVGGAIAVGGARFGGQETTLRALQDIMLVHGMMVVGDGYWTEDCGHQGAAAQRPSQQDENGIVRVRILAQRVVEVAEATRGLREKVRSRETTL
ncbi:MAG: flavodoxin family protein [Syntrophomonadaceae bacterium]|nr:flavodoxin family protein [Syntrophomonadaceae bacterium]